VIETLPADGLHEPFCDRVGVGLQLLPVGIFRDDSESLIPTIHRPVKSLSCSGTPIRGVSTGSSSESLEQIVFSRCRQAGQM
jgi:hypothetical protein